MKISTKRILKTLVVMAVMLSVAALPAMAEPELDQNQTTVQAGTPVGWRYNGMGQTDVPSGLTDVIYVAAGSYHSLALTQKPPDTTPPEVSSTSPSKYATEVAATADISATVLEEGSGIDPDTLDTCFRVEQVKTTGNVQVQGNVTYDADSQTATFDPSSSLAKGLYQATLTGVKDNAGNVMPDYTWTFTTAGPSKK